MKPLAEMSALELRAELDAAIAADGMAEYQDGLGAWAEAKRAAHARQKAVVDEMARRHAHWQAIGGTEAMIIDV